MFRSMWLKDGDKNMKYFYVIVFNRVRKNFMGKLKVNEIVIEDVVEMKKEILDYFYNIYSDEGWLRFYFGKFGVE